MSVAIISSLDWDNPLNFAAQRARILQMTLGVLTVVGDFDGVILGVGDEGEGAFPKSPKAQRKCQHAHQNNDEDVAACKNPEHFWATHPWRGSVCAEVCHLIWVFHVVQARESPTILATSGEY